MNKITQRAPGDRRRKQFIGSPRSLAPSPVNSIYYHQPIVPTTCATNSLIQFVIRRVDTVDFLCCPRASDSWDPDTKFPPQSVPHFSTSAIPRASPHNRLAHQKKCQHVLESSTTMPLANRSADVLRGLSHSSRHLDASALVQTRPVAQQPPYISAFEPFAATLKRNASPITDILIIGACIQGQLVAPGLDDCPHNVQSSYVTGRS